MQRPYLTVPHAAAGLLAAAVLALAGCGGMRDHAGASGTDTTWTQTSTAPIVVEQPTDGEKVSSPIHVEGTLSDP